MKLRNKQTGDIRDFIINKDKIQTASAIDCWEYNSLAELSAEWEDYEEPKEYWCVNSHGEVLSCIKGISEDSRQSIGNYFNTREEAEKSVEKLKAWKRLKGEIVGWSFSYDLDLNGCGLNGEDIVVGIKLPRNVSKEDLNLLFGGEE